MKEEQVEMTNLVLNKMKETIKKTMLVVAMTLSCGCSGVCVVARVMRRSQTVQMNHTLM